MKVEVEVVVANQTAIHFYSQSIMRLAQSMILAQKWAAQNCVERQVIFTEDEWLIVIGF